MLSDSAIRTIHHPPHRGSVVSIHDPEVAYDGLKIEPFDSERLNPASYDLTLSPVFRYFEPYFEPYKAEVIDLEAISPDHTKRVDVRESGLHFQQAGFEASLKHGLLMQPGTFLLMATNEVVTLPTNLAARVEGKSSLGRLGLAVHITAGFIDPGFHGSITLEVANLNAFRSLRLHWDKPIAQIAFVPMSTEVEKPYGKTGHYQDQPAGEPVESRYRP